jgi:hypothetical protein
MKGSQEAWEVANPNLELAPNGLYLIQGCQPLTGRSKCLSINSEQLVKNPRVFLVSSES